MTAERDIAVRELWKRVNILAVRDDMESIRNLIAEARIEPGVHCGDAPETFDGNPTKIGEWVLGNWADMINHGSPFLNTARNISLSQYEDLFGVPAEGWT